MRALAALVAVLLLAVPVSAATPTVTRSESDNGDCSHTVA